jgi:hypothetical protein
MGIIDNFKLNDCFGDCGKCLRINKVSYVVEYIDHIAVEGFNKLLVWVISVVVKVINFIKANW